MSDIRGAIASADLGAVTSIQAFGPGGSSARAFLVRAQRGEFVLKRRAAPTASSLEARDACAAAGIPVPMPIAVTGAIEIVPHVAGRPYAVTAADASSAGAMLGRVHDAIAAVRTPPVTAAPPGAFADAVRQSATQSPAAPPTLRDLARTADAADAEIPAGPARVLHGDWHPGNLIWRAGAPPADSASAIAAVLDFDDCRSGHAAADLGPAALHFALPRRGTDPLGWPLTPDAELMAAFWHTYPGAREPVLVRAAVPCMIRSLAAEVIAGHRSAADDAARGHAERLASYAASVVAWVTAHRAGLESVLLGR